jgi:cytochrome c biogenesis protein CcdA
VLDQLVQGAGDYVHTNPWLAVVVVFLGGMLTASNPCVLAMIPLMMAFVAGDQRRTMGPLVALGYSALFILGLSIMFTALGIFAALAGKLYGDISSIWNWVVAGVCLLMGLHMIGLLKIPFSIPFEIKPKFRGPVGAFVLGLLFGVVSTPCAAPILVVLLTYLAGSGSSVAYGGLLLLVYGLGHSALILVAGTSMGAARRIIESSRWARANKIMQIVAGVIIIVVGAYFAYLGFK